MRIYQLALELVASVFALAREVRRRNRNLADQMERACASVPLNMQEGWYSRGGNRVARTQLFSSAKKVARTRAILDATEARATMSDHERSPPIKQHLFIFS